MNQTHKLIFHLPFLGCQHSSLTSGRKRTIPRFSSSRTHLFSPFFFKYIQRLARSILILFFSQGGQLASYAWQSGKG